MPLMKASRLAFVLILPFFPIRERNAAVCMRPWYFLRCRTLTVTVMKRLPAVSVLSYFSVCFFSFVGKVRYIVPQTSITRAKSFAVPHGNFFFGLGSDVQLLCRYCVVQTLINSAVFLHTRETIVHVQVLNKQRRHPSSDWRRGCSEWVAKCFSQAPFTSFFSLGTIMSG